MLQWWYLSHNASYDWNSVTNIPFLTLISNRLPVTLGRTGQGRRAEGHHEAKAASCAVGHPPCHLHFHESFPHWQLGHLGCQPGGPARLSPYDGKPPHRTGPPAWPHIAVPLGDCSPVGGAPGGVSRGDARARGCYACHDDKENNKSWCRIQRDPAESFANTWRRSEGCLQTQEVNTAFDDWITNCLLYYFLFCLQWLH